MPEKRKRPTVKDVAARAGVSAAAVSMILNRKSQFSFTQSTVERVQEAARELGYALPGSRPSCGFMHNTIMIFCPVLSNPYYPGLVQSIEQAAHAASYHTFVCNTYRNAELEAASLEAVSEYKIRGVIFTFPPFNPRLVEELNQRIPVVVIGDRNDSINVDTVEISSYNSGVILAQHLLDLGHRGVAMVSTTLNQNNILRVKRMEGMRDQFKAHGCRFLVRSRAISSASDISDPAIEHAVGYELCEECLSERDITAFVAVNDMVAYGVMDALLEKGYAIPEDYSLCGFDNIFPSDLRAVSLTTVENFMLQKGFNAFSILENRIRGMQAEPAGGADSITRVEYQPRLIIRSSTGPARILSD